ncbi:unnamed protein product [Danaus chrysippus]|uniref:(African queen) hypothetical protein n=1 Tax=Danaus chrysippus TaxID=151541 RepID=A0A8J2QYF4_9NEOP|nr:unnamed protein product [Danaus chrysippus]
MARLFLTFVTLFIFNITNVKSNLNKSLLNVLECKLENKLSEYATGVGKWLENINDGHFNNSELGRLIGYKDMKKKFYEVQNEGRGVKKLSMALLPVVFQVGATSTWLTLTGLMAVKSVVIGIVLLVFKIAVSSAKVASFFTAWKSKHHHHEHPWTQNYEHHGHLRTIRDIDTFGAYSSIHPNVYDVKEYKTIPSYSESDLE